MASLHGHGYSSEDVQELPPELPLSRTVLAAPPPESGDPQVTTGAVQTPLLVCSQGPGGDGASPPPGGAAGQIETEPQVQTASATMASVQAATPVPNPFVAKLLARLESGERLTERRAFAKRHTWGGWTRSGKKDLAQYVV